MTDGAATAPSAGCLLAACVVASLHPDSGSVGTTAIDKRASSGAVRVKRTGLYADLQANRKYHGGLLQAVYAYAQEDAEYWQQQLGRTLHPGWFGENLRTSGIDISNAGVGERWRIGDEATGVVLEVTSPRTPCQTFARWVGGADERGWVKRFAAEARTGAYLKVVNTGVVAAGDAIRVISRIDSAPTVRELFTTNWP